MQVLSIVKSVLITLLFSLFSLITFAMSEHQYNLTFSTYLGGKDTEDCDVVAQDHHGNAYLGCHGASKEFFLQQNDNYNQHNGMDAFIVKINHKQSTSQYLTRFGGQGWEAVQGIVVDKNGDVFAVGTTYSDDFPTTLDAQQTAFGGESDAFIIKLNKSGKVIWSTFFGGSDDEDGRAITLDKQGNIHIVGRTQSKDLTTTDDAIQPQNNGKTDIFIATFNSNGQLTYSTYYGGTGDDIGFAAALSDDSKLIVSGRTTSSDFPTKKAFIKKHMGGEDVFVLSLADLGKTLVFSSYFGGSGNDRSQGVAMDKNDDIYVLGSTTSRDIVKLTPQNQNILQGDKDAFLMKLSGSTYRVEFLKLFGGRAEDKPRYLALDHLDNAIVVGHTLSSDFAKSTNVEYPASANEDGFIVKIDSSTSNIIKSAVFGGNGVDAFEGLAVNPNGSFTVSGASNSTDFDTRRPLQSEFQGGRYDIILFNLKF